MVAFAVVWSKLACLCVRSARAGVPRIPHTHTHIPTRAAALAIAPRAQRHYFVTCLCSAHALLVRLHRAGRSDESEFMDAPATPTPMRVHKLRPLVSATTVHNTHTLT